MFRPPFTVKGRYFEKHPLLKGSLKEKGEKHPLPLVRAAVGSVLHSKTPFTSLVNAVCSRFLPHLLLAESAHRKSPPSPFPFSFGTPTKSLHLDASYRFKRRTLIPEMKMNLCWKHFFHSGPSEKYLLIK